MWKAIVGVAFCIGGCAMAWLSYNGIVFLSPDGQIIVNI